MSVYCVSVVVYSRFFGKCVGMILRILILFSEILSILMSVLWTYVYSLDVPFSYPLNYPLKDGERFDYVVVGAGAAGSAAAARLTLAGEDVLLLEAGGDPTLFSLIPAVTGALLGSNLDWKYETIPNNASCLAYFGEACRFVRGKCLGDTTAINLMFYIRGNPADYDDLNIPGWSWDELWPYFLRFEGFKDINRLPIAFRRYHNTSGIMRLGFFADPQNPWEHRFLEGYRSIGFNYNPDQNAGFQIGVSVIPGYVHQGLRMSTARGYLANDKVKSRLKVAKNTLCTGLIIDDNNVTTGVTAVVAGRLDTTLNIYARKEVILSAGTIGTPQILMLSGIGHADHLQEMGIPVRADLPVGDNMSDHVMPLIYLTVDGDTPSIAPELVDLLKKLGDLAEFLVKRDGPLATNNIGDINTFINTRCYRRKKLMNDTGCELPTIQLSQQYIDKGLITIGKSFFQKSTNLNDNAMAQLAAANKDHALIHVLVAVLRSFSRGTVRLASPDPLDYPAIFANYFGDSRDIDEALRAIDIIEDLVESPIFKKHNASLLRLKFPGCPRESKGHKYWRCYVQHMTSSVFHATGTCGMEEVVDSRLCVRHVHNVRVADLSVLPDIPRGNPEAIALVIGEKVVDLLREDHASRPNVKHDRIKQEH